MAPTTPASQPRLIRHQVPLHQRRCSGTKTQAVPAHATLPPITPAPSSLLIRQHWPLHHSAPRVWQVPPDAFAPLLPALAVLLQPRARLAPPPFLSSPPLSPAYPSPITLAIISYRTLPERPSQLQKGTSQPSRVCGCTSASVRCAPCALYCRSGGGKLGRDGAGLCRSPLI